MTDMISKISAGIPDFWKSSLGASVAAVVLGVPAGAIVGYWLGSLGLSNGPTGVLIALPLAGTGSLIIDRLRKWRSRSNATKINPVNQDELDEIHAYATEPPDKPLIDSEEELFAAVIASRLGALDVKHFPLLRTEEEYAREVFNRINPVLCASSPRIDAITSSDLTRKQLGPDPALFTSYLQLLGRAHYVQQDNQTEVCSPRQKPIVLKALASAQILQISVQLGRNIYTYHVGGNHFGRVFGITVAVCIKFMVYSVIPLATALGIEACRYAYHRHRLERSFLRFDSQGRIVNTSDLKQQLTISAVRVHRDKKHDEPLDEIQLKALERKRDRAEAAYQETLKKQKQVRKSTNALSAQKALLEKENLAIQGSRALSELAPQELALFNENRKEINRLHLSLVAEEDLAEIELELVSSQDEFEQLEREYEEQYTRSKRASHKNSDGVATALIKAVSQGKAMESVKNELLNLVLSSLAGAGVGIALSLLGASPMYIVPCTFVGACVYVHKRFANRSR